MQETAVRSAEFSAQSMLFRLPEYTLPLVVAPFTLRHAHTRRTPKPSRS